MNARPANTQSPHLDLEELLAEVNGEAVSHRAREHLATCERCHAEALRWDTVAGGVRGLMGAVPEVARPSPPRPGRVAALAARKPRTLLAAGAAAALLLIGGASYGLTSVLTRPGPAGGNGTAATLTGVKGCADLKEASGTLEGVSGTSVIIKSASGKLVTVTTSASTMVNVSRAPLSDITDGASVLVAGRGSGETIAAQHVDIGVPVFAHGIVETPPGIVTVHGTVQDAGAGGFTVVRSDGTRVAVTTSSETDVTLFRASLTQLKAGAFTLAVGRVGADGALAAIVVAQPPSDSIQVEIKGCTPASIDAAITTALVAGG
jgi:DNA/RNA endonuclease YhcR with UshA esterase domain